MSTESVSYLDSNDNELKVGSDVHLSVDAAIGEWDEENNTFIARAMDWGKVAALNPDGTVQVQWNDCGCFVDPEAEGRTESANALTLSTEDSEDMYYLGLDLGREEGRKANQDALRRALGLKTE